MNDAELAFEYDGFEEPLKLLLENTKLDDRDLRLKVICLCVENHDLLEIRIKTLQVLQEHEPNVWSVSAELLKQWMVSTPTPVRDRIAREEMSKALDIFNALSEVLCRCPHFKSRHGFTLRLEIDDSGTPLVKCAVCHKLQVTTD